MENLWSDSEAKGMNDLDSLVYMSRLIGANTELVVWGGGNTSIKVTEPDIAGNDIEVLKIKGSGSDLKTIRHNQFAHLRQADIVPLIERKDMTDEDMVDYLDKCMLDPKNPRPSVETLLHAFLPFKCVAHSHADAIVSLTNNVDQQKVLTDVYKGNMGLVEYIRPGFLLSKLVGEQVIQNPNLRGVILAKHGLFTWGDTAKEAYDRHIDLVTEAETYLKDHQIKTLTHGHTHDLDPDKQKSLVEILTPMMRGLISKTSKKVLKYDNSKEIMNFLSYQESPELSQIGPATPDHLIHTKQKPLWVDLDKSGDSNAMYTSLKTQLDDYAINYDKWYEQHTSGSDIKLDPFPRVILIPQLGMWTTGKDAKATTITGDIYHHTINVMTKSEGISSFISLSDQDAYDMEYWPLEQYKLTLAPPDKDLASKVALITGAANGIGKAIAATLATEGAHVFLTDIDETKVQEVVEELKDTIDPLRISGCSMDVTNQQSIRESYSQLIRQFGGIDILVSNAGIAPDGAIDTLELADWQRSLDINTTGHFLVASHSLRIMKSQDTGGSMIFIGTKNIPAPGAEFGAYSVAKAAEGQLARIIALEGGEFGIRANIINPDAVFQGTNLWSDKIKEARASAHGIDVTKIEEFYQNRSLLKKPVFAEDVAEAALFLASDRSSKTTGAMIPVDSGVKEAFPR